MSRLTSVHVNIPLSLPEPRDGAQKTCLCDAAAAGHKQREDDDDAAAE